MSEQSLNDILHTLKRTEEKFLIYIPSLKSEIEFSSLTLAQQKSVIDKITSSSFGIIDFYNSVFEIIKSSAKTDISNFNTIDRINIILSFRKNINPIYDDINVNDLLDKNKNVNLPDATKTIVTDKFTFDVSIPTLATDYKFNSYLINTFKDEKMLLGKLLVNELCKFISKITVNENSQVIDFAALSMKNKYTVLEAIDSKQLKDVFDYINQVRDVEVELVKLEDKQMDIGPELFVM